ncbi:hypothetical protein [Pedobacter steynii]
MQKYLLLTLLFFTTISFAQKKPLDHTVYDSWESIASRKLSNNGNWAAYAIAVQEGDANLYLTNLLTNAKTKINRAENAQFSTDSKFAVFAIKPFYSAIRQAKIKKKKPEEMPKDSLGIANLTNLAIAKVAGVKSFKLPEDGLALLAYQLDKPADTSKKDTTKKMTKKVLI